MGGGKLTPLTTPTPFNLQSPNIAHVIMSTISVHTPHLVKIAPGVTSPNIAKVTTHFFITSDKGGGKSFCPRLSVSLSVSKLTQKRMHGFG